MATITLQGNPVETAGQLPALGTNAPDFTLTGVDLADITLSQYQGKRVVMNVFPSIDTGICAMSTRKFNEAAQSLENTVVLCISRDLPFAHARFCGAEGLKNVVSASEYKNSSFSDGYRTLMTTGPMSGLMSRAVVVVDEAGKIIYHEQVPEIAQEPNYDAALASLG
ncbi:MAG: thiol peroxidase [Bacteroidota bacterium]